MKKADPFTIVMNDFGTQKEFHAVQKIVENIFAIPLKVMTIHIKGNSFYICTFTVIFIMWL